MGKRRKRLRAAGAEGNKIPRARLLGGGILSENSLRAERVIREATGFALRRQKSIAFASDSAR
jgi:hypothetical protein